MPKSLFGSLGTGIAEAQKALVAKRQKDEELANQATQLELTRTQITNQAKNDTYNRRSALNNQMGLLRKDVTENARYYKPEDLARVQTMLSDWDSTWGEYAWNGTEDGFSGFQQRYQGGVIGTSDDGTPLTLLGVQAAAQANKPVVDRQDKFAADLGVNAATALTNALALSPSPAITAQITALASKVGKPPEEGGITAAELIGYSLSLVYSGSPSQFLKANVGKMGLPATKAEALAFLQATPRGTLSAEEQTAWDSIASQFGGFNEDGTPKDPNNQNYKTAQLQNQAYNAANQQTVTQAKTLEAQLAALERGNREGDLTSPDRIAASRIAVQQAQLDLDNDTALSPIQREQAQATLDASKLALKIATDTAVSTINKTNAENVAVTLLSQFKSGAERAELLERISRTGTLGISELSRMRDKGVISESEFVALKRDAEQWEIVQQAGIANQMSTFLAQNANNTLTIARAEAALSSVGLERSAARATELAKIGSYANGGDLLRDLLASKKITQSEYNMAIGLVAQTRTQQSVGNISAAAAAAQPANSAYLAGARSAGTTKNGNVQAFVNSISNNPQFASTAAALGYTATEYAEYLKNEGLIARQASLERGNDRASTAAEKAEERANRARLVDDQLANSAANRRESAARMAATKVKADQDAAAIARGIADGKIDTVKTLVTSLNAQVSIVRQQQQQLAGNLRALQGDLAEQDKLIKDPLTLEADKQAARARKAQLEEAIRQNMADASGLSAQYGTQDKPLGVAAQLRDAQNWLARQVGLPTTNAPTAPRAPAGTYIRDGKPVTGSPQQPSDWDIFTPDAVAASVINDNLGSGQFSLPQLLSDYRSDNPAANGLPASSSKSYNTIAAKLTNTFAATGAVNNLENRRRFLQWLEDTYKIDIPEDLGLSWLRG